MWQRLMYCKLVRLPIEGGTVPGHAANQYSTLTRLLVVLVLHTNTYPKGHCAGGQGSAGCSSLRWTPGWRLVHRNARRTEHSREYCWFLSVLPPTVSHPPFMWHWSYSVMQVNARDSPRRRFAMQLNTVKAVNFPIDSGNSPAHHGSMWGTEAISVNGFRKRD